MSQPVFAATKTWVGGTGSWTTGSKWSPVGAPGSGDDAVINSGTCQIGASTSVTANTITVGNGGTLEISDGNTSGAAPTAVLTITSIVAPASVVNGTLRLQNGQITGAGTLTVNGTLEHKGGKFDGSGLRTLAGTTTLTASANWCEINATNISNSGTITVNAPSGSFSYQMPASGTLTNTGVIQIASTSASLQVSVGSTFQINNNSGGAIRKTTGPLTSRIEAPITNAGGATVEAQAGTLELYNGGTANGTYSILSGATLTLASGTFSGSGTVDNHGTFKKSSSGTSTISGTVSNASGATVQVQSGTLTLSGGGTDSGTYDVSSGAFLSLTGGTFTMTGTVAVTGAGTLNIAGATMTLGDGPGGSSDGFTSSAPITFTSGTIELRDCNLQTSSTLSVTGTIEHYGGSIVGSGSGSMTINSGGIVRCHATNNHSNIAINTTINSGGQIVYTDDIFYNFTQYGLFGNITITNNGTIDIQTDFEKSGHGLDNLGGSPTIVNGTGTIKKSASTLSKTTLGIFYVNVPVTSNSGSTVEADSGSLKFTAGGTFTGTTISGAGSVILPAGHSVAGTTTVSGTLKLTGNPTISGTLSAGGTLYLDTGVNVTWPNVSLTAAGSKIDGPGALHVSGTFSWAGGTITGAGTRDLQSTSTPTISCSAANCTLDAATLSLNASATLSATTNSLAFANGGTLVLASNKTLTINADGNVTGSGTITNNGTITKSAGSNSSIAAAVNNAAGATVQAQAGTLALTGGGTVAGTYSTSVLSATVRLAGGTFSSTGGAAVSGSGTVDVATTVDISNAAAITLNAPMTVSSGGTLNLKDGNIAGTQPLTVSGIVNVYGGSIQGSGSGGTLTINGGAVVNFRGTMNSSNLARNTTNNGTINYTNDITTWEYCLFNSAVVTNNGIIDIQTAHNVRNLGGAPRIDNGSGGVLKKSFGSGSSTINFAVNNAAGGTVQSAAGTLALTGGGANSGAFDTADAAAVLSIANTAYTFNNGASVTGSGTVTATNVLSVSGTLTVSGTLKLTGNPTISGTLSAGGTLYLDTGVDVTWPNVSLTAAGSKIDGPGALHVSGTFSWAGGTITGSGTRDLQLTSTPTISCSAAACTLDGATLSINTSATFSASANALAFANAATLTIFPGKTLTINADGNITGSGTITNNGTLTKSGGSLTSTIAPAVNGGTVSVTAGTLALAGGGTHGGPITATSPGTIAFAGGTHTITGTLSGTGALAISAGTATFNADGSAGGFTLSGGTLGGSGNLTLTNGGTWSGGTMSGSGKTTVPASKTLSVSGSATLSGRALDLGAGALLDVVAGGLLDVQSAAAVTGSGTLRVNGGTLRVPTSITQTIAKLTFSSGVIDGAGTLALSGASSWSGGTMGSATASGGVTRVDASGTLAITPVVTLSNNRQLTNNGGTIDLQGDGNVDVSGGGTINNDSGTLTKSSGSGTTTLVPAVNNSGSVTVSTGTLALAGGGTHSGSFSVTSPARLAFTGGVHTLTGPLTGTGTVAIGGGTFTLNADRSVAGFDMTGGTLDGTGILTLTNGGTWANGTMSGSGKTAVAAAKTLSVSGSPVLGRPFDLGAGALLDVTGTLTVQSTVTGTGSGTLRLNGGTLSVANGVDLTWANLALTTAASKIDGNGALRVSGTFTWDGGTITGSGARELKSGSTPVISCVAGNCTLKDASLLMNASATLSASTNKLVLHNTSVVTIAAGKTLNITNGGNIDLALSVDFGQPIPTPGFITNNGAISKSAGSGTSTIAVNVNNAAGATVQALAGTLELTRGGTDSGVYDIASGATLALTGGSVTMSGSPAITGTGTLDVAGATVTAGSGVDVTCPNLKMSAAASRIDGAGIVRVGGNFTWDAGTLAGTGTRELKSTSSATIGCAAGNCTLDGAPLLLNAPATYSAAANALVFANAASLTIASGATLDITTDGDINGSGTIANNGTLTKSGGTGVSTIAPAVNNSGSLTVTAGKLELSGGGTHSGAFTMTSPGVLSFPGGAHTIGGSLGGSGTVEISGNAAVTLNAAGNAGGFTMSGGTLDGSGTLTLTNGGTWSGGTMGGNGKTINPTGKALGISMPVTLGRTLQNDGTLNVNANVAGDGTINNNDTLNAAADAVISPHVNNGGQIATSSTLTISNSGTHSGTFTANTGGVIDFSGGVQTISGTLAGSGTIRFSGAAATVSGPWSGTALEVSGGSVDLNSTGSTPSLTMSGGTLGGSANVTVTGPSSWSGGLIGGAGNIVVDTGAVLTMPGTNACTLFRPLRNKGTINYAAVDNPLTIYGKAVTNDGIIDFKTAQSLLAAPGTPMLVNNGTLKKSAGGGTPEFQVRVSNAGIVQIDSGTLNFTTGYEQSGGTTTVSAGAALQSSVQPVELNGGSLKGNGTIKGRVNNNQGTVAPGNSPGTLTIDGDFVQASNGVLDVEIGGTAAGTQYDQLVVTGTATLDGALQVVHANGFVPVPGNSFHILTFGSRSGQFSSVTGADYGGGLSLISSYHPTDLTLVADFIQADLGASVAVAPSATVPDGSAFVYNVSIVNGGGSDATAVQFTAALPANVTFVSANPPICGGAPNLVCTIGNLANGASAGVSLNVVARAAGNAPLTVTAAGAEIDPNPANNSASASASITPATDLAVVLAGPASVPPGVTAVYTITVTNNGPEASNAGVGFTASDQLSFGSNSGGCTTAFPCSLGTLAAGQVVTITSSWTVAAAASGFADVTATVSSTTPDLLTSNNSATKSTTIAVCPDVTILAPLQLAPGATAAASITPFPDAGYLWSIDNGSITSGATTDTIIFTAGSSGTTTLAVTVSVSGCTRSATLPITVKAPPGCTGSALPIVPAQGTFAPSAAVEFNWTTVAGASGYRVWLQADNAQPRVLGTTLDVALTQIIPPGSYHWWVETLFAGCASHESEHLAFTVLAASNCDGRGRPSLAAPAEGAAIDRDVTFVWQTVPNAIAYELWLAPDGGVPTLLRSTAATTHTATVPAGRLEWFVRAVFAGCTATESDHRTFTFAPPSACAAARGAVLIAPADGERLSSPVAFDWSDVDGATGYEVLVDGALVATTTESHTDGIALPDVAHRWLVRTRFGESCPPLDSAEGRFVVIPKPPTCTPLDAPVIAVPGQISTGISGRLQWSFVPGATHYTIEMSSDAKFNPAATASYTVTDRTLPIQPRNLTAAPLASYVRVHAANRNCVPPIVGPYSRVAVFYVLPENGSQGAALASDPADVRYSIAIGAEFAGLQFKATPSVPWLTVTPAAGIVPAGGTAITAVAHTAGLPYGTSIGNVAITFAAADSGTPAPDTVHHALSLNVAGLATDTAGSTPDDKTLIIPVVAAGVFHSDVAVSNNSARPVDYKITFIPTGAGGDKAPKAIPITVNGLKTVSLNDILQNSFGTGALGSAIGALQITPKDPPIGALTAGGTGGLPHTAVSSRTFSVTPHYVPAVSYADFVGSGGVLSLQQIAQSDNYSTSLGFFEGSGHDVRLTVRVFDAGGQKLTDFPVDLKGGHHLQIDEALAENGIANLENGRVEIEVTRGDGKITAYASVVDKTTDELFVSPTPLGGDGKTQWVVAGVSGTADRQTEVRLLNTGKEAAELTLSFYTAHGAQPKTEARTIAAGELLRLDNVASLFDAAEDGALHIDAAAPAQLIATARTFKTAAQGTAGQFIPAVTAANCASVSRSLQLLQIEESSDRHSDVGLAEMSGKPVTLKLYVAAPDHDSVETTVALAANEFRTISSLFADLRLGANVYNARITVSAVEGEGCAAVYASVFDKTHEPTYIPGQ